MLLNTAVCLRIRRNARSRAGARTARQRHKTQQKYFPIAVRARRAAYEKWSNAQARLSEEQELRNTIRETAIEAQDALVSLRKTLKNTLGSSHRDYQKLRLSRGKRDELQSVEQLESITSSGESDSSYIGDNDVVESVPIAAAGTPASGEGGNGRGAVTGIDPYFTPTNQTNPPTGSAA